MVLVQGRFVVKSVSRQRERRRGDPRAHAERDERAARDAADARAPGRGVPAFRGRLDARFGGGGVARPSVDVRRVEREVEDLAEREVGRAPIARAGRLGRQIGETDGPVAARNRPFHTVGDAARVERALAR